MSSDYSKYFLQICTPCYGGHLVEPYVSSLLAAQLLFREVNLRYRIVFLPNESLITNARNKMVASFLVNSETTHLMFIDADIEFNPHSILKLLKAEQDVVAGAYPKKVIDWDKIKLHSFEAKSSDLKFWGAQWAVNRLEGMEQQNDLLEVLDVGAGFLLIRREVFEQMAKKIPQLKYQLPDIHSDLAPHLYAFFDTMIDESKNYLSEDVTFCKRWRSIGGKVWVDTSVHLNHIGTYTYSGRSATASYGTMDTARRPEAFQPQSLWALAMDLFEKQDFEAASIILKKLDELQPKSSEVRIHLGFALFQSGHGSSGRAILEECSKQFPDHAKVWFYLGLIQARSGEWTDAKSSLKKAVALAPKYFSAHYVLAQCLTQAQDWEAAEHHYNQALALEPEALDVMLDFAQLELMRQRQSQARQWLENVLQKNPSHPRALDLQRKMAAATRDK